MIINWFVPLLCKIIM